MTVLDALPSPAHRLRTGPAPCGPRLVAAPPYEPPYDDELPSAPPPLRLLPAPPLRAVPSEPAPAAVPTALEAAAAARPWEHEDDGRTPSCALPPARPFAHALVQRLLEVAAGVRPLAQLQRDTTPELYAELEALLVRRPRATGPRPTRADVRSVHVQQHPDGVAEVCATVVRSRRAGALALRVEGWRGRWVCSAVSGV